MTTGYRTRGRARWLGLCAIVIAAAMPPSTVNAHSEGNTPSTVANTAGGFGGPFSLTSHAGDTVSDGNFRGKVLMVYFGYTHCPDICPIDAQNIGAALDLLGNEAPSVQPLFITVDPARDRPARLAAWLGAIHPRILGLTGTAEEIAAVAKAYKVVVNRIDTKDGYEYTFNHPGLTYVMGVDGRFLFLIPPGTGPDVIAREIRSALPAGK